MGKWIRLLHIKLIFFFMFIFLSSCIFISNKKNSQAILFSSNIFFFVFFFIFFKSASFFIELFPGPCTVYWTVLLLISASSADYCNRFYFREFFLNSLHSLCFLSSFHHYFFFFYFLPSIEIPLSNVLLFDVCWPFMSNANSKRHKI